MLSSVVVPTAHRRLLRDLLILALTLALWMLETRGVFIGPAATVLAILTGLMTGVVGFLFHEWGHALGAKLSGGTIYYTDRLSNPFLFFFDTVKSTRQQFLAMSYGGYLATAIAVIVALACMPWDRLAGQIGLAIAALSLVVTVLAEVPSTVRVARGGPMPSGYVYRSGTDG